MASLEMDLFLRDAVAVGLAGDALHGLLDNVVAGKHHAYGLLVEGGIDGNTPCVAVCVVVGAL